MQIHERHLSNSFLSALLRQQRAAFIHRVGFERCIVPVKQRIETFSLICWYTLRFRLWISCLWSARNKTCIKVQTDRETEMLSKLQKHVLKRGQNNTQKSAGAIHIAQKCSNSILARKGKTTIKHYEGGIRKNRLKAHLAFPQKTRHHSATTYNHGSAEGTKERRNTNLM